MTSSYAVPAIHRAMRVLDLLAASHSGFSLAELSRQTKIPKSSLFRILLALEEHSVVIQDPERKVYSLGMRLLDWGNAALDNIDLRTLTHPHLVRLAHETQESFYLAILDDYEVIIIDRADTPDIWRMVARLGSRSPVHATASGQVLVAELGPEAIDRVVERTGLKRFTSLTITTAAGLKRRLERTVQQGFAVANGEYKPDLCVVAVPVRDHRGRVAAALMTALHSDRARRDRKRVQYLISLLQREATLISAEIGYRADSQAHVLPQPEKVSA